jgi:hypothetical protein
MLINAIKDIYNIPRKINHIKMRRVNNSVLDFFNEIDKILDKLKTKKVL